MVVRVSNNGTTMTTNKFSLTRRVLLAASIPPLLLALPALAQKAPAPKVTIEELMAPNALPDIVQGKADAPVTIVEYASMTCGHCAAFHHDVYPTLKKDFIETGKVRFILREFPLDPIATAAFMLARSLGDDKRDAAVDLLFAQQKNWAFTETPLEGLASVIKQTGIGQTQFEATLKDAKLQQGIVAVRDRAAEKFGVNATPTFFINGVKFAGEMKVAELDKIVSDAGKAPEAAK
jgi:protein-disulfide isomerase